MNIKRVLPQLVSRYNSGRDGERDVERWELQLYIKSYTSREEKKKHPQGKGRNAFK